MTRLYDSFFASQNCLHASGDNLGRSPEKFNWRRDGEPGHNAWFTDSNLSDALQVKAPMKVAWILEPREYRRSAYQFLSQHPGLFDVILTYDRQLLEAESNALFYAFGGARIAPDDWTYDKPIHPFRPELLNISIIASEKKATEGQQLRHRLIANSRVQAYGPEYKPIERKLDVLSPSLFHVAIEAVRSDFFFTEALIDAFLTGCVPIYWGCPSIGRYFDTRGMILCEDYLDLRDAVQQVSPSQYEKMLPFIRINWHQAMLYHSTEDWLFRMYPYLFDESCD